MYFYHNYQKRAEIKKRKYASWEPIEDANDPEYQKQRKCEKNYTEVDDTLKNVF